MKTKPKTIKIPIALFELLSKKAKGSDRTLHGYIIHILKQFHK